MAEYNIDESVNQFENDVKLIKSFTHNDGTVNLGGDETPTLKTLVDNISTGINETFGKNTLTKRNVILSARNTDGNPEFLLYPKFLNMEHENSAYVSNRGIISSSSEYNSSYRATKPLRNQIVFESHGWLTTSGVKNGWWQYDFTDGEHCLCGLMLGSRVDSTNNFPKTWKLLGYNFESEEWETIYQRDDDQPLYGVNSCDKKDLRMYWFTENTKMYKRVRIDITDNYGGTDYSALSVIKFFENTIPGQSKDDVILYASEDEPFIATIAHGTSKNSEYIADDRYIKLNENVTIPGGMLYESARNYISIVLADDTTQELPETLDKNKAIKLNNKISGQNAYLYIDTRKINYCSLHDLKSKCLLNLYCNSTEDAEQIDTSKSTYAVSNKSLFKYTFNTNVVGITTTEPVRGRPSSYSFKDNSYLISNKFNASARGVDNLGSFINSEFTLELDCKYSGPDADSSDKYYTLFSNTSAASAGLIVGYLNKKKCIAIYYGVNGYVYNAPFNLDDSKWHHISISSTQKAVFVHVDGKLINFYENPTYFTDGGNFTIGRIGSGSAAGWWNGYINNVRYYNGVSLYTSKDYVVSETQQESLIPDKILWRDPVDKIIKEYNAQTDSWTPIYMLPIGHIDTSLRYNILTDQPTGTYQDIMCKGILSGDDSGNAGSGRSAIKIFNFYEKGASAYCSANVNTTDDVYLKIVFEDSIAFDRLWFVNTNEGENRQISTFIWSGSNDNVEFDPLIDETVYKDDGRIYYHVATTDEKSINSYKEYKYDNATKYKIYKLEFPTKSVPPFNADGYVSCRLIPFFKDSAPEILEVSSNVINGEYNYGPYVLTVNTPYFIPVPFSNLDYEIDGEVLEYNRFDTYRRKLMQIITSGSSSQGYGELVFKDDGQIIILTGNAGISSYSGSMHNPSGNTANNTYGNYYLKLKQI